MASAGAQTPSQVQPQASKAASLEGGAGGQDPRAGKPATGSAAPQLQADIVAGAHEESMAAAEQASRVLRRGEVAHGDASRAGGAGLRVACRLWCRFRGGWLGIA